MATRDFQKMMMGEARRNVRIKEDARLLWHIKETGLVGEGRVRNISTSGMLIELAAAQPIPDQSIFSFDSNFNKINYIPQSGRLIWQSRKRFSGNRRFCGVQFTDVPEVILSRLGKKVDDGVRGLVRVWQITNVVGRFSVLVAVGLVVYASWLGWDIYQGTIQSTGQLLETNNKQAALTREYQRLYTDTTRRLTDVTLELNQTTALYQQSQQALQNSQQELAVLQSVLSQTETMLARAQSQDTQNVGRPNVPSRQAYNLDELRGKLNDPAAANIRNLQEGRALIALYQDRIQTVRSKLNQIKRDNQQTKIAALEERDRVRLMLGNQGYFVRNGQAVQVDMAQYYSANPNIVPSSHNAISDPRIKVNVTVFQQ